MSSLDIKYHPVDTEQLKKEYPYLKEVDLPSLHPTDVTLLIGSDFPNLLVNSDFKCGTEYEPYAVKMKLGWVLMGGKNKDKHINLNLIETFPDFNQFWNLESYGTLSKTDKIMMTKDEKRSASILEKTTVLKDGRYEIGLLWKEDTVSLLIYHVTLLWQLKD